MYLQTLEGGSECIHDFDMLNIRFWHVYGSKFQINNIPVLYMYSELG